MFSIIRLAALAAVVSAGPSWAAYETQAKSAIVIDLGTDTVLLEKDADVPLPPASMSKLMTLNMLFEALRDGRVTMDTEFGISPKASAMGGSKMFLRAGDRVAVRDLIPGIIVQSGNDACVVVAEGLAGSEDAFARLMNQRAADLGMTGSTFANSSGWPDPAHRMSLRDLAFLAERMVEEFPEYYGYYAQEEFTWEDITQRNRNPLLGLGIGADGLKTGHTQEAGYGLTGSAQQGNRRIVFVVTGLDTVAERAQETEQLVNWAFRQFVEKPLMDKDTVVAEAPVWMGDETRVNLVAGEDVTLLMPALAQGELTSRVIYRGPIEAPIAAGDPVAELVVERPGLPNATIPLVSDRDVARGGFLPRVRSAVYILAGKLGEQIQTLW
ncbi:MAG: D-alanyl-D-alanine carboxypeptidase family protein [Pseudomonadota bacterium]